MKKGMLDRLKGRWALVTGASAGIGREFCTQLAAAGLNLVLVARRQDRLENLAERCRNTHGVECMPLPMDLSVPDGPQRLADELDSKGIEISLLVNNAGVGQWGRFEQADQERIHTLVNTNVLAPVSLCLAFFEHLKRQAPDSAVINVSSQAALQPVPFMAVYGASKAFVHSFSLALYEEWKEYGIHVQTLIPGPTKTEFDEKAGAYESKVTRRDPPEKAVEASLAGLEPGRPVVASVSGIFTQRMFAGLFPPKFVTRQVAKMFRPPSG